MKGSEVLEEIEKAGDNVHQADRLQEYLNSHPDASEKLSEAAGLSVPVSSLINALACCQEKRLQELKKALMDADIGI